VAWSTFSNSAPSQQFTAKCSHMHGRIVQINTNPGTGLSQKGCHGWGMCLFEATFGSMRSNIDRGL
jgi:hypothetical protein